MLDYKDKYSINDSLETFNTEKDQRVHLFLYMVALRKRRALVHMQKDVHHLEDLEAANYEALE